MCRRRLSTLGRQPAASRDKQVPPVCEKWLVVGTYRRPLCPPMPQSTGHQPTKWPMVDLRSHLPRMSDYRTALPTPMWPTRLHPKQRCFPSGIQLAPGSCSCLLARNAGRVVGPVVVLGTVACASHFTTSVCSLSSLCRSFFSRRSVVLFGATTLAPHNDSDEHRRLCQGGECHFHHGRIPLFYQHFHRGRIPLFYQLTC